MTKKTIAVVLKGYPRLSETFIAQELLALERAGLTLRLYSLRAPSDERHPIHDEIAAPVTYLPEYLVKAPVTVIAALRKAARLPGFRQALRTFAKDFLRNPTPSRVRRFGQAAVLATVMPDDTGHIYSHFIHTPSSVARYASLMRGLPWSFSAHAKDIWTLPDWEKREKLADAVWGTTCTGFGHAHLQELAPEGEKDKMILSYHGLDISRFPDAPAARPARDGSDPADPVRIVSVGRAVEKKGYDVLLEALAGLPADLHWRFVHIGGGVLADRLAAKARALGIDDRVEWLGAREQGEVARLLASGDLFVLASRILASGDRDGLPNVLMEAASQKLCSISTNISGIPEFILDDRTGLLVEPEDAGGLRAAIDALARDPARRERLGSAAHDRLKTAFSQDVCIANLASLFGIEAAKAGKVREPEPTA